MSCSQWLDIGILLKKSVIGIIDGFPVNKQETKLVIQNLYNRHLLFLKYGTIGSPKQSLFEEIGADVSTVEVTHLTVRPDLL